MAKVPTIIQVAVWIGRALAKGSGVFNNFSAASLGTALPEAVIKLPAVADLLKNAAGSSKELNDIAAALETAAITGNTAGLLIQFTRLGQKLSTHFSVINNLQTTLNGAITPATIPDAAQRTSAQNFVAGFAKKIADQIILSAIEEKDANILFIFKIIGLVDWGFTPAVAADPLSTGFVKKELHLERFSGLIKNPLKHFTDTIGWGGNAFDPTAFFNIYSEFFDGESGIEIGNNAGSIFMRHGSFLISTVPGAPTGLKIEFKIVVHKGDDVRQSFSDQWAFTASPKLDISGGVTAEWRPPLSIQLSAPAGQQVSGELKLFVNRNEAAQPFDILGGNDLLRISAKDVQMGIALQVKWDAGAGKASVVPVFFLNLVQGTVKLGTGDADSFIGSLLSGANIEANFDLGLEWDMDKGMRVQASGGVEVQLPIHKKLGPIDLNALYIALKILPDATLALETSVGFTGTLGPFAATVDRIGIELDTKFTGDTKGTFGPLDMKIRFKPPNGIGLALDLGVISGGGYLFFDFDKGEYAGALELNILYLVSAKAIALISTRMPDGSSGFSLLIIITAEFTPPIQLSFGFTLIGLGGLLGLNRTVLLDPLREGVRTGAINSIMFPQNVIANAARIISDLKTIFPPYPGKFLIGPMAKAGWGTPTLISLSLGVIIEIPGNIAILGVLRIALPEEHIALVNIQVNFLGTIDFGKQMLTFDASLYESYILFSPLEGDMAVRMKWGDNPTFLISVGGFHPQFTPPPLALGVLKRLSITIISTPVQRLRLECYQAVTSNTVQLGARIELRYGFSECNVTGFLGFDALFQFSPFHFIVQVTAGLSAEVFGLDLLSIQLDFSLEGPGLWRAKGSGKVKVPVFPDINVSFDITWGEAPDTTLPTIDILPKFIDELNKLDQWKANPPRSSNLLVSLRKIDEADGTLVLHPAGTLVISQKLLPLNLLVDKIGNQPAGDVRMIRISSASCNGFPLNVAKHEELFARAQYKNMDDAEKLSLPSFQRMESGVELTTGQASAQTGTMVMRSIEYETLILDKDPSTYALLYKPSGIIMGVFGESSSVKKSALSMKSKSQLQPFVDKPAMKGEGYTVATQSDNKRYDSLSAFSSEAMANDYLNKQIAANPNLKKELHIIPDYELNVV